MLQCNHAKADLINRGWWGTLWRSRARAALLEGDLGLAVLRLGMALAGGGASYISRSELEGGKALTYAWDSARAPDACRSLTDTHFTQPASHPIPFLKKISKPELWVQCLLALTWSDLWHTCMLYRQASSAGFSAAMAFLTSSHSSISCHAGTLHWLTVHQKGQKEDGNQRDMTSLARGSILLKYPIFWSHPSKLQHTNQNHTALKTLNSSAPWMHIHKVKGADSIT